jgi:hypothetical protein
MLEYWNTGIMGSGRLGQWFVGKTLLTRKLINERFPCKTIIPIFQHSIIPCARQKLKAQKIPLISMGCRISETLYYQG